MDRIEIYRSSRPRMSGGGWRWKFVDGKSGKRLATSAEGMENIVDVGESIERVLGFKVSVDPSATGMIWYRGFPAQPVKVVIEP